MQNAIANEERAADTKTPRYNATSLCNEGENIYFSCKTKQLKIMSLCGAGNKEESNYIYYRFGKSNKIEMDYPENKDSDSLSKFRYIRYSRIQLNKISVSFFNNGYWYGLYSEYDAESPDGKIIEEYGITVDGINGSARSKTHVNIRCASELINNLGVATEFIPCQEGEEFACNVKNNEYK